jgi:hypothetical protein
LRLKNTRKEKLSPGVFYFFNSETISQNTQPQPTLDKININIIIVLRL